MLTASGVPRALKCPASLVLKRTKFVSEYAEAGIEHHEELEAAIDVGYESAIPDAVQAVIREGDETITERAFAYDVATDTARELPAGRHRRDYSSLKPFEIPGTPDLIVRGARVTVVDHKSFEQVDAADRNTQAATYALMIARAWKLDEIDVLIHYKAQWRKPSHATLTALDLDAHAARLKQLQLDVTKARANPLAYLSNGGSECKYCECQLDCPRWDSLRKQVASGELALLNEARIPFEDDNEAADAFDILQRLKLMTSRLTAALYARAKERPIPLPDGMVLAEVTKQGNRQIDADKAYELIRSEYGQIVADKAVTREATQKGIEIALKEAGVNSPTKAKDSLVKKLEESGAITRSTKTRVELVPAVKLLKESA